MADYYRWLLSELWVGIAALWCLHFDIVKPIVNVCSAIWKIAISGMIFFSKLEKYPSRDNRDDAHKLA